MKLNCRRFAGSYSYAALGTIDVYLECDEILLYLDTKLATLLAPVFNFLGKFTHHSDKNKLKIIIIK
jgi:hypothetical protein